MADELEKLPKIPGTPRISTPRQTTCMSPMISTPTLKNRPTAGHSHGVRVASSSYQDDRTSATAVRSVGSPNVSKQQQPSQGVVRKGILKTERHKREDVKEVAFKEPEASTSFQRASKPAKGTNAEKNAENQQPIADEPEESVPDDKRELVSVETIVQEFEKMIMSEFSEFITSLVHSQNAEIGLVQSLRTINDQLNDLHRELQKQKVRVLETLQQIQVMFANSTAASS